MPWLERLKIAVQVGNLLEYDAEAIGSTLRTDLRPYGKLSQAVFAGREENLLDAVKTEALERYGKAELSLGSGLSVPVLPEYGFPHPRFLVFAAMWNEENSYSRDLAYGCYASILREASRRACRSLAVPIFTLGDDRSGAVAGDTLKRLLFDFDELRNAEDFPVVELAILSVDTVRVVGVQEALRSLI